MKFRWETEFKETEIGEIPKDWEVKEVKHLVDKTIKFPIVDGPFGTQLHMDEYTSEGIPVIRVINLSYEGEFIEDDMVFISEEKFNQLKRSAVKPNDLIIAKTGATIGKLALLPKHINQALITSSCLKVTFDLNNAIPKYYLYFFITQIGQENIKNRAEGGSTRDTINLTPFSEIPVPLPPLHEQSRIATVLSWFDDLIENKKRQNEILEKTAMAIFKSWFIDFVPFKDEGFVYNEELGREIPKGWEVKRLGDVVEFFDHKRIPLSQIERLKRQGIYPYYGANGIIDYVDDFLFDGKFLLVPEDGIIADKDGYTISFLVNEKFWANNHIHVLKGKLTKTEFLYLFLRLTPIEPYITGAVQPKLSQGNMSKIPILLPPPPILQSFHFLVEPLFQKIILNQKQIMTLRKIRDTLLPLLVFGKLRVEEI